MSSQDTAVQSQQQHNPNYSVSHDSASEGSADQTHATIDNDRVNITDVSPGVQQPSNFSAQIATYQAGLDTRYREYEAATGRISNSNLESLDWNDLETRYRKALSEKKAQEHGVMQEIETTFRVGRRLYVCPNSD